MVSRAAKALLFDIETDGLLPDLTKIHCIVTLDPDSGELLKYGPNAIIEGLSALAGADVLIGHNILGFDIPAIQKVVPFVPPKTLVDTLVLARVAFPDIKEDDFKRRGKGTGFPGQLIGRQSLEAWGYRLKVLKGDYGKQPNAWDTYTPEMLEYCAQDVRVTEALWNLIRSKEIDPRCVELEHAAAKICLEIEDNGFPFDVKKAEELTGRLIARRSELHDELVSTFGTWWTPQGIVKPKRTINGKKRAGTWEGAEYTKIELTTFNPGSRHHIARCLKQRYNWHPKDFTDHGTPKVDEAVLSELPYPEAQKLTEYFLVQKRLGQLAEGRNGWIKRYDAKTGCIHGRINPNGAVTGRGTHHGPNIAQVPGVHALYGRECRELFQAPPEWLLVGTDKAGLELRCLAHYMARYDGGAYARVILEGDKAHGTDIHSVNCRALGMDPRAEYTVDGKPKTGRDIAKTFIYAFLYGAGDAKIGAVVGRGPKAGRNLKTKFLKKTPALKRLIDDVKASAKKRKGHLIGLDGRVLPVRSSHAALNTLLQSAGAILCKKWMTLLADSMAQGIPGAYRIQAWVHDELQIAAKDKEAADAILRDSDRCARLAGEYFRFRVPLEADGAIGQTWADTH